MKGFRVNSTGGNMKNIQIIKTVHNESFWNFTVVKPANMFIYFINFDFIAFSTNFVSASASSGWGDSINSTRSGFTLTNSSIISQP